MSWGVILYLGALKVCVLLVNQISDPGIFNVEICSFFFSKKITSNVHTLFFFFKKTFLKSFHQWNSFKQKWVSAV